MTELELRRKLDGECTRCGAPAGDTNLCPPHELDLNARAAASMRKTRQERQARGECVDCAQPSARYRCRCCRRRERPLVNTLDGSPVIADI